MGASRLIRFEPDLEKEIGKVSEIDELKRVISNLSTRIGKEIDYIEKQLNVVPVAASGNAIVSISGGSGSGAGTIQVTACHKNVITGANFIQLPAEMPDEIYEVLTFLYHGETLVGWSMKNATAKTKTSFVYTADMAGSVYYIVVASIPGDPEPPPDPTGAGYGSQYGTQYGNTGW